MKIRILGPLTATVLAAAIPAGGVAQDAPPTGLTSTAEFSFVFTGGNASSSSLGFRSTAEYRWPHASFQIAGGGIRTESETTSRTATGTPDDFTIVEDTESELTAANYFARSRYDRTLSAGVFVFTGAGWERNTFAGVEHRVVFPVGTGKSWVDRDDARLKTDLGATYTIQEDVVEDPESDDAFAGLRASVDLMRRLTETARFTSLLIADESLNETSDLRLDWTSSLSVAISSNLALKSSYQLLFDNEPALVAVPLDGGRVFTPLEKVDSVLTLGIQVSF